METEVYDVIIAGAGLSGLCTAHFLKKFDPELNIMLLEKTSRAGGAVKSMMKDGFLAEWGPHGFLDNSKESGELLNDLDLTGETLKATLKKFVRYICLNGQLTRIPQTPPEIIRSNLIPFSSKTRILADLWKKPLPAEQTIADWTAYRFGRAMIPFADIAMTGTYAGDINRLSIDAAMPGLRRLELESGSVFKGAIKLRKKKKSGMPSMISFEQGLERLTEKLTEFKHIIFKSPVTEIAMKGAEWSVKSETKKYSARKIVLALHINQALPLMESLSPPPKRSVAEAKIINIVMGFGDEAEIPFGFGYLTPESEKRFALGALFSTHMFPGRAPGCLNSLEVLTGGIRNPKTLELDDSELINRAYRDLKQLIRLPKPPVFTNVLRPLVGIPQLEIGHLELIKYRDQLEKLQPGLCICGFGWEGIGMNEMIKHARVTAKKNCRWKL